MQLSRFDLSSGEPFILCAYVLCLAWVENYRVREIGDLINKETSYYVTFALKHQVNPLESDRFGGHFGR